MFDKREPMSILSAPFSSALLVWPAPTSEMEPWAYNWWMGSAVDEAGLRVQVEEMSKVGNPKGQSLLI